MKKLILAAGTMIFCLSVSAQNDSTRRGNKSDTIRIGKMILVRHGKNNRDNVGKDSLHIRFSMGRKEKERKQLSNVSTNWWVFDLGFSNYVDNTNYATAGSYLVNRPGYPALDKNDLKLRSGKSVNVNIWIVMQRLNLAKHYVNLKYGLGLELNNYRYRSSISYKEGGQVPYTTTQTNAPFIFRDSISFSKDKLAADYVTVPLLLNFTSNPNRKDKGISFSAGVSAGYLYSQRNKQKSSERGKDRNKGDYDLQKFKLSYIAELGLGPIRLYGSYSPRSMYDNGLDIKPYTIGFRFSNW